MKFWAVWRTNGDYFLAPKHKTKDAAIEEAIRLCNLEEQSYCVMEMVGFAGRRYINGEVKTIYSSQKDLPRSEWESKVLS